MCVYGVGVTIVVSMSAVMVGVESRFVVSGVIVVAIAGVVVYACMIECMRVCGCVCVCVYACVCLSGCACCHDRVRVRVCVFCKY